MVFPPDLCGVCFCCRRSESHASPHRPQVCQQSGGHQILRSGPVPQTWVLKAQESPSFCLWKENSVRAVSLPKKILILLHLLPNKLDWSVCFFTEYLTPSFSFNTWTELSEYKIILQYLGMSRCQIFRSG